jgi:hypothetical protein
MATTLVYPKVTVSTTITGVASEATLSAISTKMDSFMEEVSKDVLANFFQDPNTLTNAYQTAWTVAGKALEAITIKQNDGNVLSIAVNGAEKIVSPPSGEVQHFPLKAAIGDVIGIKIIGAISNAGPVAIEFLG